jgi:hypothetical protein
VERHARGLAQARLRRGSSELVFELLIDPIPSHMTDLSREEAELYYLVLREVGGGYGSEIKAALGAASSEVFNEIRKRLLSRAKSEPDATGLDIDDIDWAAIRAVAPVILSTIPEDEFRTATGRTLKEVRGLLVVANAKIRQHEYRRGYVSHQRGTCVIRLPATALARNITLAGVQIPSRGTA